MNDVMEYLRLIRPYGMLYLGFTPVFGAICNGGFVFLDLSMLFFIGILAHIFTFVQNDYFDVEIDSKSKYVSNRPLVTGSISQRMALGIVVVSFLLSAIISVVFLFSLASFFVLMVSFLLITIYNKYSKRLFGMEYILAMGIFTYGLFGALTVSDSVSSLAIIISFVAMMQWLFSVGIFANLKDVKYDTKTGVKTTPTILGVKTTDGGLYIPVLFKGYGVGMKIVHIVVASLPFVFGITSFYVHSFPIPSIVFFLLSVTILYLVAKIFSTPISQRDTVLVYEGLQEGLAFLLIPVVLLSYLFEHIGIIPTLLLIAMMILWPLLSLRMLFGKQMIPLE